MASLYFVRRVTLFASLVLCCSTLTPGRTTAQTSKDFAVLLSATPSKTPAPSITLHWNADPLARAYQIVRKEKGDPTWPNEALVMLDSAKVQYVDQDVEPGVAYEYEVRKSCLRRMGDTAVLQYVGVGYICAGIEILPAAGRGGVLLLIDSTMAAPLATELDRLEGDLTNEGWDVVRRHVARTTTFNGAAVKGVRDLIKQEYTRSGGSLRALFIIGRVAVPYSGRMNPDAHPDHIGAWPADGYYGDVDGNWTDASIRDTSASRAQNRNVPGDGKFDQTQFPSPVDLQVGRVDFYDMPAFTVGETELLRKYLDKNHAFRTGQVPVTMGGIVDDNFSAASYPEAFASAAWRNIPVFGGEGTVKAGDWFTTLGDTTVYLWAYGCGGGNYVSAGGVGSTNDLTTKPVRAVFTMLFGSYFGDWDSQNNFLRAALCSGPNVLTCSWVARPQWYFHHMGLGETIGYSTRLSQNNQVLYIPNIYYTPQYPNGVYFTSGNRQVHIALLGDPTLRAQMSAIAPARDLDLTLLQEEPGIVRLDWGAAAGAVDGYLIYRSSHRDSAYALITSAPVTSTTYIDTVAEGDSARYMVRSVVLRTSASGTYYDAGAPVRDDIRVASTGSATLSFSCGVTPNPARTSASIALALPKPSRVEVEIHDLKGELVRRIEPGVFGMGESRVIWDLADARGARVPAGVYVASIRAMERVTAEKIVVLP